MWEVQFRFELRTRSRERSNRLTIDLDSVQPFPSSHNTLVVNPSFPFSPLVLNLLERIPLSLRRLSEQSVVDVTGGEVRPRMGSSRYQEVDELDVGSRWESDEGVGALKSKI